MNKNTHNYNRTFDPSNEEIQRRERAKQELVLDRDFLCWQIDAIEGNEEALEFLRSVFPGKTTYWDLDDFDLAHMRYVVIPEVFVD